MELLRLGTSSEESDLRGKHLAEAPNTKYEPSTAAQTRAVRPRVTSLCTTRGGHSLRPAPGANVGPEAGARRACTRMRAHGGQRARGLHVRAAGAGVLLANNNKARGESSGRGSRALLWARPHPPRARHARAPRTRRFATMRGARETGENGPVAEEDTAGGSQHGRMRRAPLSRASLRSDWSTALSKAVARPARDSTAGADTGARRRRPPPSYRSRGGDRPRQRRPTENAVAISAVRRAMPLRLPAQPPPRAPRLTTLSAAGRARGRRAAARAARRRCARAR